MFRDTFAFHSIDSLHAESIHLEGFSQITRQL